MNTKNDVEVIINGKQYTLSGYESSEYLQKIANHINDKLTELKLNEGYMKLEAEMKNIYLAINLTDDYYKVQQSVEELQKDKEGLETEIFNIKHDMIEMKSQLEERQKEIETLQQDKTESEHKVIRLETELETVKTENSVMKDEKNSNVLVLGGDSGQEGRIVAASVEQSSGEGAENSSTVSSVADNAGMVDSGAENGITQVEESESSGRDVENAGNSVRNIENGADGGAVDSKHYDESSTTDIINESPNNINGSIESDGNNGNHGANGNNYNSGNHSGGSKNNRKNRRSGGKRR